jgi:hypothetical protein
MMVIKCAVIYLVLHSVRLDNMYFNVCISSVVGPEIKYCGHNSSIKAVMKHKLWYTSVTRHNIKDLLLKDEVLLLVI